MSELLKPAYQLEFPGQADLDQDEEWCWVTHHGNREKIRFHDYGRIFSMPGLYEAIFDQHLKCDSPSVVGGLLQKAVKAEGDVMEELTVLDLGPGNGMVGEYLHELGVPLVVGVDILSEAAEATRRDRPGIYTDFVVADLTRPLDADAHERLYRYRFNCLTQVAGLGFGDIPPLAFINAYNMIQAPGWLAFNIKEDFISDEDDTGFAGLIRRMERAGLIEQCLEQRYRHRFSTAGKELHYVAFAMRKKAHIPLDWLETL